MNSILNSAIEQASRNLSTDRKLVEAVYKSYWRFIKEHVSSYTLKEISQEEFDETVTNFNIPYLGKLYVKSDKLEKYNNQLNYYKNVKAKKNQADRLSGVSD
jgi:hypothetical protein